MAILTTDFIKIAQAGPSIDGRFIREDWIRDMAETYDPATYTAMLWPEHCRWCGNCGEVIELKDGHDDKGVYCLYARFQPNAWFLERNAAGQGLFYSLEVAENFADTGKTYLEGLGVTDSPASLGLQSTRFSTRKNTVFIGNVPFEQLSAAPDNDNLGRRGQRASASSDKAGRAGPPTGIHPAAGAVEDAPGWFKRLFPFLFTSDSGAPPPEQKDPRMEELEARVAALEESLTALKDQLAAIDGRVAALEVDVAAGGGEGAGSDPAYKALARQIGSFRKEMTEFTQKVSAAARPGTQAPGNTGPAKGKSIL